MGINLIKSFMYELSLRFIDSSLLMNIRKLKTISHVT